VSAKDEEILESIESAILGNWSVVGYLNAILRVLIEIAKSSNIDEDELLEKINQAANDA